MKLYEIKDEYRGLLSLAEDGELTAEAIADTLEAIEAEFTDKARSCVMVLKELEAGASAAKAESERLKALADSRAAQAERLKEYIADNMKAIEKDKLDLGIFALTLKKAAPVVDVLDESVIPERFFVTVPETKRLDKRALLADLKDGEIPGAALKDGKCALIIK